MNKQELQKLKEKALENNIPIIMDDTLEVIKSILEKEKPKRILEIGTAVGYSALCFSEYLADGGSIDTIEIDETRANEARENIKCVGAELTSAQINVILGNAVEILPTLDGEYDIVFIDAAKGQYLIFLEQAKRLIKDGGVIIADNILYKGYVLGDYNKHKQRTAVNRLREYIKLVTEDPMFETEILDVGDGLGISRVKK